MNKQQRKRFLINAAIVGGLALLIAVRMPIWGVAQVFVLLLLVGIAAFQLVLYFKLK